MKYIIVVILMIFISGCDLLKSHSRWALEHQKELCVTLCSQPIDTNTSIISKDTAYTTIESEYIGIDSLMLYLLFDCDSNKQVYIKNSELLQSKNGKLLYELNKGKLIIKALYDSIEVKNKIIHEVKTNTITTTIAVPVWSEKVIREKYIPYWVYLIFGAGGIIIIYLLIRKLFI